MEAETMILPPRTRLYELKSSADFSSEEFNHSIKTWVNMASLLVKQGNMAETNSDDENAYISYVRACLIITKIIPHQALYPTMMNDIACIDLRQKILGIVARMGHLERRLLKRFELENQERIAYIERGISASPSPSPSSFSSSLSSLLSSDTLSPPSSSKSFKKTPNHPLGRKLERVLVSETRSSLEEEFGQDHHRQQQQQLLQSKPLTPERISFRQEGDEDEDANEGQEVEDLVEMKYELPSGHDLSLEFDPQAYVSHHHQHRRTMTEGIRGSSPFRTHQASLDSEKRSFEGMPTLKKKSSNEDDRSLLSPECQPNYSAMPSALFARQREGFHVRRCSSTDAIRTSVHFPATINAYAYPQQQHEQQQQQLYQQQHHQHQHQHQQQQQQQQQQPSTNAPAIPPRSQKRSSMVASLALATASGVTLQRSNSSHSTVVGLGSGVVVPDYRGTCVSSPEEREGEQGERTLYAREVLKTRFSNRRTMSFESNSLAAAIGAANSVSIPKISTSQLKKSNSISKLSHYSRNNNNNNNGIKGNKDQPPTPEASNENPNSAGSSSSLGTHMSMSSGSVNHFSMPSSVSSTPLTSPLLNETTSPHMQAGAFASQGHAHGHSYSLTSIASGSTGIVVDISSSAPSLSRPLSNQHSNNSNMQMISTISNASNISNATTVTSNSQPSTLSPTQSSNPTFPSTVAMTTITATGKKATAAVGLLRKIRSRPKMKDQLFEIVASPEPTPSPPPHLASQGSHQQQLGHARQLSGSQLHRIVV